MLPARRYIRIFDAGFAGLFGISSPRPLIFCTIFPLLCLPPPHHQPKRGFYHRPAADETGDLNREGAKNTNERRRREIRTSPPHFASFAPSWFKSLHLRIEWA